MTAPAPPHPYDGVAPKNAACTACGYLLGGIRIQAGQITCPECGHAVRFELPRSRRWDARLDFWLAAAITIGFSTILGVGGAWRWALGFALVMLGLLLLGAWRRSRTRG